MREHKTMLEVSAYLKFGKLASEVQHRVLKMGASYSSDS